MKTDLYHSCPRGPGRAYTLTEIMVAMAIFSMVIIAVIYANMFGLRLYMLVQSKLSSTEDARRVVNDVRDKIQSAKIVEVGVGNATTFTPAPLGSNQQGNALQIYPTTNTASSSRFFYNPATRSLQSLSSATPLVIKTEAQSLTNRDFQFIFFAEDEFGNVMTNSRNNRVIRFVLEFYQLQYPTVSIGPGQLYDYYRLQTRVTPRVLE
ncbi:MAG: prepilin-type N-terminal cleavage/methylation domain-containing protein [Opitutaceae bacterium]|nr:prepilin-type N-terminal cleavage/methylation domain-containing protein [Verrucomicrobiales bacterium]